VKKTFLPCATGVRKNIAFLLKYPRGSWFSFW